MKANAKPMTREEIAAALDALRKDDGDAAGARLFSLVYPTRPDVLEVAKDAYTRFFSENALNPMTFPSLARLEAEIIDDALALLHAPAGACGSMTSGGSESLLLAVKTARDWARATRPEVREPEMLLPVTAHPALLKAAHLVGVRPVLVPTSAALVVDVAAARELMSERTILVVGSAPQYPHGVVDPIAELGALAAEHGVLCHIDACIGGFFLPWLAKLGRPVPAFDFAVPGVTSISADLHKYAYAAKGASVVLYRTRALRRHQFYVHADWPGGLFGSPGVLGTRPGGAIAAAWAVSRYLGEEGYVELARRAMDATERITRGVRAIDGLHVLGEPVMSLVAIGSSGRVDPYVIGDRLQERGWRIDRQHSPPSLHLTISPAHDAIADRFLSDLAACSKTPGERAGTAAMYGMLGELPDRVAVRDALLDFMDGMSGGAQ
jgi:glutamate/tyrosine decarboxylase-like PLP-dependent enzyme